MRRLLLAAWALGACACGGIEPLILDYEIEPTIGPGELCYTPDPAQFRVRVEPRELIMAPGQTKRATIVVDPDVCTAWPVEIDSDAPEIVAAPEDQEITYGQPTFDVEITGSDLGVANVTVVVPTGQGDETVSTTLAVDVREPTLPTCDGGDDVPATLLAGGGEVSGTGGLSGASISLPEGADVQSFGAVVWTVEPFEASISCASDITPSGYVALGPAVRFGPQETRFPRDVPMTIPLNPARMPEASRMRHLRVAYSGPAVSTPRPVPVTDPRLIKSGDGWALSFKAPRLGTYQAVVHEDAGSRLRTRRLTHRAILGVSMGGAGAAQIGVRHHQLFDAVAALGGPVDWSWLIDHIEHNQLGGFPAIAPGTTLEQIALERTPCTDSNDCGEGETCLPTGNGGKCALLPVADEPYEHTSTFNTWWYEPGPGNGGSFDRGDMSNMIRDLTVMYGNPFGYNEASLRLPAGVDPTHPALAGPNGDCSIWVKPYDHPDEDEMQALAGSCPASRCEHTQVLEGFYDRDYNPDGTFPVITFCDGAPQNDAAQPYGNTWSDQNNNRPMEASLAVDYNANGVRDEMEPVITQGHEPWSDWGLDGLPSHLEPGYAPDNLDPSGDDYDPRYNPGGFEGDARYQLGEPFEDVGLDGVANTASSPYDFGEGDGLFNVAPGLQRFWDVDARSMVHGVTDLIDTPLDDDALARLDIWTDGGNRDLFNFAVAAEHFLAPFTMRGRLSAGFSDIKRMPGLDPASQDTADPALIVWEDLQGAVNFRYGADEPTEADIENGNGQHAGSVANLLARLQSGLYFIDARWPDAPRAYVEETSDEPAEGIDDCQLIGNCVFEFTSSFGRRGPVSVTLPPGYGHAKQQHVRYPVVYVLHGYGMTPEDLQAAIIFLANWMNGPTASQASRLGKAILVYADGRCRWQDTDDPADRAECYRGTFYADSPSASGPQMDAWFLELIDHIDANYRTLGDSTVDWVE